MHKSDAVMKVRVKVPATSANMGPGFDCMGIALSLYNIIDITCSAGETDASLEHNLIYKAMNTVFSECGFNAGKVSIYQSSRIPVTRGLGSSAACIIGGMLGANFIAGKPFDYSEILNMATKLEGHPDNVTPALYGGFCTTAVDGDRVYHTTDKITGDLKFAAIIPDYFVATRNSRGAVPQSFSKEDAVYNISHASMMAAALIGGKTELLKIACRDRLHQQYRQKYIDGMEEIFNTTYECGSLATYLSGSGPTVISVLEGDCSEFMDKMNAYLGENHAGWRCRLLTIDNVGAVVSYTEKKQKNWRF